MEYREMIIEADRLVEKRNAGTIDEAGFHAANLVLVKCWDVSELQARSKPTPPPTRS